MMTHPARGRLVNGNLCVPVLVSKYVPIPAQGQGQSTRAVGVEAWMEESQLFCCWHSSINRSKSRGVLG